MKIEFWSKDRPPLIVDKERGERLVYHISNNDPKFIDFTDDGYGMIAVGEIKAVTEGAESRWNGTTNSKRLIDPSHTPLESEEAIKRIREIKEKFLGRKHHNG